MLTTIELEYFADPTIRNDAIKACRDMAEVQRKEANRAKHVSLRNSLNKAATACEQRANELEAIN